MAGQAGGDGIAARIQRPVVEDHVVGGQSTAGRTPAGAADRGLVGALGGGRLLESMLFGVEPADAVSLAAAAGLTAAVALLACLLPAWRAARTAPVDALRAE